MKKIEFFGKVCSFDNSHTYLKAIDSSSENYLVRHNRISLIKMLREISHDKIVKVTVETVKK